MAACTVRDVSNTIDESDLLLFSNMHSHIGSFDDIISTSLYDGTLPLSAGTSSMLSCFRDCRAARRRDTGHAIQEKYRTMRSLSHHCVPI